VTTHLSLWEATHKVLFCEKRKYRVSW